MRPLCFRQPQRPRQRLDDLRGRAGRAALLEPGDVIDGDAGQCGELLAAQAGTLTLDCDVLTVQGSDLRIMIYTAEPGTEDADRLALITVLGTQALVG